MKFCRTAAVKNIQQMKRRRTIKKIITCRGGN
jgi:hypothetical protein